MILRCSEKHKDMCLEYLYRDKVRNLFIIGDIINYGFEADFQTVFIDVDNEIHTVYLVYRANLIVASYDNIIDNAFIEKVLNEYGIKSVCGTVDLVNKIKLDGFKNEDCFLAKMEKVKNEIDTSAVKELSVNDIDSFLDVRSLVFNIKEKEAIESDLINKAGRSFYIKDDNRIVSIASSTAECEGLAMIIGVATIEKYRNQGYATKVVNKLCSELLEEGKTPCLFYNSASAGSIYKALGFEDVGTWALRRK